MFAAENQLLDADPNKLAVAWRVYFDYGAALGDFRAAYRAKRSPPTRRGSAVPSVHRRDGAIRFAFPIVVIVGRNKARRG